MIHVVKITNTNATKILKICYYYSALDEKMNVVFSTYSCLCSHFVAKYSGSPHTYMELSSKICYEKYL